MLCLGEGDRLLKWGEEIGRSVFPIGVYDEGLFFLGIDEHSDFLYENPDARTLVKNAVVHSESRHDQLARAEQERIEASWRERALNAEGELARTQKQVFAQRQQIGDLMGQIRDFDQMVPGESLQALTVEKTTLKRRILQLTGGHRKLQERLEGARSNLRFADKRIADLESQLLERDPT